MDTEYRYEWLRDFVMKRPFLTGTLISDETYTGLKNRTIAAIANDTYLWGFVDGWRSAKGQYIHLTSIS